MEIKMMKNIKLDTYYKNDTFKFLKRVAEKEGTRLHYAIFDNKSIENTLKENYENALNDLFTYLEQNYDGDLPKDLKENYKKEIYENSKKSYERFVF